MLDKKEDINRCNSSCPRCEKKVVS